MKKKLLIVISAVIGAIAITLALVLLLCTNKGELKYQYDESTDSFAVVGVGVSALEVVCSNERVAIA